jgi:hypothetical protein
MNDFSDISVDPYMDAYLYRWAVRSRESVVCKDEVGESRDGGMEGERETHVPEQMLN